MGDDISVLGKSVIIGGSEHIRDSDYEEALVEGTVYIGDSLAKGTNDNQVVGTPETSQSFRGIAIGHSIRQSDTEALSTALTVGKYVKYLKPTGGRVKVRVMVVNYTSGATIPAGSAVFSDSTGSTIGASTVAVGDFYIDPLCGATAPIVGRTCSEIIIADGTTDLINQEMEMWY